MRKKNSILYLGTDSNKIVVVRSEGNDFEAIQTINSVAPNPLALPEGVYNGIATEWISKHPRFPLLYALTSYWNASEACVTTFRISSEDGKLTQLGKAASTGGMHAAHATFSPDGSLYVIAHHNDGKLVFFDSTNDNQALEESCLVLETPQVIPGTRRKTQKNDAFPGLPSLHHVQYSPNGAYLLTVDPSQDRVFTYPVDKRGLPTSQTPVSHFKCYSDFPIYGLFQRLITRYVLKCKRRVRKAVIHPNGRYIYILYESINRLQVYRINEEGIIDGKQCWQDLSTLDPSFTTSFWCPVGLTLQLAAELYVTQDGSKLLLSNRGDKKVPGSRGESSVRVFSVLEDGRRLEPAGALPGIAGPVRHFVSLEDDTKLIAGLSNARDPLQVYGMNQAEGKAKQVSSDSKVVGKAMINANVFCIAC